jgi:hypothetical protein
MYNKCYVTQFSLGNACGQHGGRLEISHRVLEIQALPKETGSTD